ncbi:MAG: hypothetical protein GY750_00800 [Lentisphaerae bacterium]|nr:hypothetical protein [Lentisphaerota bacterium]MCP4099958.1 hypothetical protein [Lentisphaerota bacterium]
MDILANQTVGQIVANNLKTSKVFEAYQIDFCCHGNIELTQACRSKGIDLNRILSDLNNTSQVENTTQPNFFRIPLYELTKYIVKVHHEYMYELIPEIKQHLQVACGAHAKNHPELKEALHTFTDFKDIFYRHLRMEEKEFFPYVGALTKAWEGTATMPNPLKYSLSEYVDILENDHRTASELILKVKSICNNYQLPDDACITYRLFITELQEMEADTHIHITLENNVLHPRAKELERELHS